MQTGASLKSDGDVAELVKRSLLWKLALERLMWYKSTNLFKNIKGFEYKCLIGYVSP